MDNIIKENKTRNIQTDIITTYQEFFEISDIMMNTGFYICRGHSNCNWELLPSILRPEFLKKINLIDAGLDYESYLSVKFQDSYKHYINIPLEKNDYTSLLLIMQHYGIPTRLLDWTLNPQTALFFALNYDLNNSNNNIKTAAIWFLNPIVYRSLYGTPGGPYRRQNTPEVNRLSCLAFLKEINKNSDSEYPVIFYPNSIFPRIIAQESIFSVHGWNSISFDDLKEANKFLRCIIIKDDDKSMYYFLNNVLKLNYDKYFPDIYGFAEALKRAWHK